MTWRERVLKGNVNNDPSCPSRPIFKEGATTEQLERLQVELTLPLPSALRELLHESDGVDVEMCCQNQWMPFLTLVWSCDELAKQNRAVRSDPDPPVSPGDDVTPLFFTSPGVDGILLAFYIHRCGLEDPQIYGYYPIEQAWYLVSPSLEAHVLGYVL